MKFPTNQLSDIIKVFKNELGSFYSDNELSSLCRLTFDAILKYSSIDILLNQQKSVNESDLLKINSVIKELKQYKPIKYILGSTTFMDYEIGVNPSVLIPRPETEELVQWAFEESKEIEILSVLDLCTGSGCIAIAMKSKYKNATVLGIDISVEAIRTAKDNALKNGIDICLKQFDVLSNHYIFDENVFDIIISNPPYVLDKEKSQMQDNVLSYEPHLALFVPDFDPLIFYTSILAKGAKWLRPSGQIFVEMNPLLTNELQALFEQLNYTLIENKKDMNGKTRFFKGMKPLI